MSSGVSSEKMGTVERSSISSMLAVSGGRDLSSNRARGRRTPSGTEGADQVLHDLHRLIPADRPPGLEGAGRREVHEAGGDHAARRVEMEAAAGQVGEVRN